MASINIDVLVPQGQYNFVDSHHTIGTQGCGPCIGIVAKLWNDRIFCGHLDSSEIIRNRSDREAYTNKVRRFLRSILNPNMIRELHYVTDKGTYNSKLAADMIDRMFFAGELTYLRNFDGLHYDGQQVQGLAWGDHLIGYPGPFRNDFSC